MNPKHWHKTRYRLKTTVRKLATASNPNYSAGYSYWHSANTRFQRKSRKDERMWQIMFARCRLHGQNTILNLTSTRNKTVILPIVLSTCSKYTLRKTFEKRVILVQSFFVVFCFFFFFFFFFFLLTALELKGAFFVECRFRLPVWQPPPWTQPSKDQSQTSPCGHFTHQICYPSTATRLRMTSFVAKLLLQSTTSTGASAMLHANSGNLQRNFPFPRKQKEGFVSG